MKISKQIISMVNESKDQWKSFAVDKYSNWLAKSIRVIEEAEQSKHIWNVDFEEAKSYIKWAYRSAHDAVKAHVESETGINNEKSDTWRSFCIYAGNDRPADGLKVAKEYLDRSGHHLPAVEMYRDIYIQPHADLMNRLAKLKPYIEKGRKPNPNAIQKPTFKPAKSAAKDLIKVKDVYTELLKDWYPAQVKAVIEYWTGILDETEKTLNTGTREEREGMDLFVASTFFKRKDSKYQVVDGIAGLMKKEAEQLTKNIQESFISKNLKKVTSIVSKKGDLEDVKLLSAKVGSGGKLNGQIQFSFNDGSGFIVHNQSVVVFSYAGRRKVFMRFPTTFHNVTMPDGKKHAMRSEEQMNTDFAGIK